MSDISDNTIDLVITDPPWNIGVQFGHTIDRQSPEDYIKFIGKVVQEIKRVLTIEGLCVISLAERVQFNNRETNLPELYNSIFSKYGFNLIESINTKLIEEDNKWSIKKLFGWNKYRSNKFYSKNGKILVFSRNQKTTINTNKINDKTFKFKETKEHPCPTSIYMAQTLLDVFYKKGDKVLDPFMGTANIGLEVIKRDGVFYGYELVNDYFNTARRKLILK